ncbi:uncharacterized protein [Nicotiana tomentosiformis]|uniref:uncharacterized protein n=1 Tax=Nicotiana tomentosiformis TaxID=4098 RepID=UPI00388CC997
MPVTQYETRFVDLARHALLLLPTERVRVRVRVRRFIDGVVQPIKLQMANETGSEISFQMAANVAKRIEMVLSQDIGPVSDKSPVISDLRQMVRTRSNEVPDQGRATPPVIRGRGRGRGRAPTRGRGRGHPRVVPVMPPVGPAEDPIIEEQGEVPVTEPVLVDFTSAPGFKEVMGRMLRFMDTITQAGLFPADPATSQAGRGAHIPTTQAHGQATAVYQTQGSTYSYVSSLFAHFLGVSRESLSIPVYVSTPIGDSVVVNQIYWSCVVTFYGYETRADLLLLDMTDFEIILGMDWLSPYHAVLNCHAKTITLEIPEFPRLEWKGSSVSASNHVISFLKARHMAEKGCLAYLAYVQDITAETPTIESVPVVREFSDVFPSYLPSTPPDRDINFCIDLASDTQPISIPPKEEHEQHMRGALDNAGTKALC